ncbi:hypothetical protein RISW2_13270 [Roseivivax isoporae LMG 25204]|uniref:Thiol:disulfide interchange protein DsbD N-terminal domain-containing protein n=2 Tax=Roseivivax TaxID=93682 RepID=X7F484_9RHOB|nr:hypothetical protein RISW2_13270 [Roseivivax isoporae LMG 25204]
MAEEAISAELRPGWRRPDGTHVAALELRLAPGWKTYWRAPGDAGIPPVFDWSGSRNARTLSIAWPVPHVFRQSGMRSVGYSDRVVLPLMISPGAPGDVELSAEMQLGVCKDICLPATLRISGTLPGAGARPDPVIAAALASRPFSASEAGVRGVTCRVAQDGHALRLTAEIEMPTLGRDEETVIEARNPEVWVAEPDTRRAGGTLTAETRLEHVDGRPFALDRSGLRITVIADGQAVDIHGCTG